MSRRGRPHFEMFVRGRRWRGPVLRFLGLFCVIHCVATSVGCIMVGARPAPSRCPPPLPRLHSADDQTAEMQPDRRRRGTPSRALPPVRLSRTRNPFQNCRVHSPGMEQPPIHRVINAAAGGRVGHRRGGGSLAAEAGKSGREEKAVSGGPVASSVARPREKVKCTEGAGSARLSGRLEN